VGAAGFGGLGAARLDVQQLAEGGGGAQAPPMAWPLPVPAPWQLDRVML